MGRVGAEQAADSLMDYLRLSDDQATVLLDETTDPPTFRIYIFDPAVFESKKWPHQWQGYLVRVIRSAPFKPLR